MSEAFTQIFQTHAFWYLAGWVLAVGVFIGAVVVRNRKELIHAGIVVVVYFLMMEVGFFLVLGERRTLQPDTIALALLILLLYGVGAWTGALIYLRSKNGVAETFKDEQDELIEMLTNGKQGEKNAERIG